MRFAADTPVGFVGGRGACAATLPDTDIPALLHEGALGALGGQLDFFRNVLTLGRLGVGVPLKANGMGHYVLSPAPSYKGRGLLGNGPTQSVPRFALDFSTKRPNLPNGGLRCLFAEDGLNQFDPPSTYRSAA